MSAVFFKEKSKSFYYKLFQLEFRIFLPSKFTLAGGKNCEARFLGLKYEYILRELKLFALSWLFLNE